MNIYNDAIFRRGLLAHDAGDFDAASHAYEELLLVDPLDSRAREFMGVLKMQTGDPADAQRWFSQAVSVSPAAFGAWNYLGVARLEMQRSVEAVRAFSVASRIEAESYDAQFNTGVALRACGDNEGAMEGFTRALVLMPSSPQALNSLGNTLGSLDSNVAAASAYTKAIACSPDDGAPFFNLGVLLQKMGQLAEALAMYESASLLFGRSAATAPGLAEALRNRGIVLTGLGHVVDARKLLGQALALGPESTFSWNNFGNALKESRLLKEAESAYERALLIEPSHVEATWNKALLLLLKGDIMRGFPLYESRWKVRELFPTTREFAIPRYKGDDAIAGRHVFLFAEQGLGDTLQFCRFARQLVTRGAEVTLEVPAGLVPLMQQSSVATRVIARGQAEPPADLQCPLMSLPAVWGLAERDLGMTHPYISADPERVKRWGEVIARDPGVLNIGICWRGGQGFRGNVMRSFGPERFDAIARRDDVVLYSLQKDLQGDAATLLEQGIAFFDQDFDNDGAFLDSLAILEHLDLVITADTGIAHLSAAAGKPTWIMLSHVPDWRWMLDRGDSPWYPSVRLFRQPTLGDWAGAFYAVERALGELIASRG